MNNSRMIDKNAHVNVIYSLEQVNYISAEFNLQMQQNSD